MINLANDIRDMGNGEGDEARIGKGYGNVKIELRLTSPKDEMGIVTVTQKRHRYHDWRLSVLEGIRHLALALNCRNPYIIRYYTIC